MAKLTTKRRNKLKTSTFGLPKERKYPMPDKSHARNAKARASQQLSKGNLSAAEKEKIDRKADRILGETDMKRQTRKDREDERKGMERKDRKKSQTRKDRMDERRGMERKDRKRKGISERVKGYLTNM